MAGVLVFDVQECAGARQPWNAGKGHTMVMNRKGNAFKTIPKIPESLGFVCVFKVIFFMCTILRDPITS